MIRKAVGAIVYFFDKFLIVGKVKLMDTPSGPVDIPLEWHIPAGGVTEYDDSDLEAIKRELLEETGSNEFKIVRELEKKLSFRFSPTIQEKTGFEEQETVMFLVEYIGTGEELIPIDEEIEKVEFVTRDILFQRISFEETKEYLREILESISLDDNNSSNQT